MLPAAVNADILPVLLLLGRPAAGKSEIIDYLQRLSETERGGRFHMGALTVLDDFPLLWSWLEEDALLHRMGKPRLHTTADGYFRRRYSWDVLVQMLCLAYDKALADDPGAAEGRTFLLEFSRGSEHGGYRSALDALSDSVAARAAVLYVRVSYEESLRKNRRRFNPARPHSILEHGLPDEKMERLYRTDDWQELLAGPRGSVTARGRSMPAVTMENEDDVTTPRGEALGRRLQECLHSLWVSGAGR
jgi:hypothetical protein